MCASERQAKGRASEIATLQKLLCGGLAFTELAVSAVAISVVHFTLLAAFQLSLMMPLQSRFSVCIGLRLVLAR